MYYKKNNYDNGSKSFFKLQTQLNTWLLKPLERKIDKDAIPKDFREFFLYVCAKSGLIEQGKAYFPEYLSNLASAIIHRNIDNNEVINSRNIVASTPPRHLKTTLCVAALLYICIFRKRKKCIYASYSDSITKEASDVFQRMAAALGYNKSGTIDKKRIGSNIVYFKGLKGGTTGLGSTYTTIVDDCVKSQTDAFSPTIRRQIQEYFESVILTRAESQRVSTIVIGTRFHDQDLLNHCMANLNFEKHIYPAISNGKALFPELRPLDYLYEKKRTVGNYVWETLYQCAPPSDTLNINVFKKHLNYASQIDLNHISNQVDEVACGIDMAYPGRKDGDQSAFVKLAKLRSGKILVLDSFVAIASPDDFLKMVKDRIDPNTILYWYYGGTEKGFQSILETHCNVKLKMNRSKGKLANAAGFAKDWNNNNVFIPDEYNMGTPFIKQIFDFTGDDTNVDDLIDAGSAAFDKLKPRTTSAPDFAFFNQK